MKLLQVEKFVSGGRSGPKLFINVDHITSFYPSRSEYQWLHEDREPDFDYFTVITTTGGQEYEVKETVEQLAESLSCLKN